MTLLLLVILYKCSNWTTGDQTVATSVAIKCPASFSTCLTTFPDMKQVSKKLICAGEIHNITIFASKWQSSRATAVYRTANTASHWPTERSSFVVRWIFGGSGSLVSNFLGLSGPGSALCCGDVIGVISGTCEADASTVWTSLPDPGLARICIRQTAMCHWRDKVTRPALTQCWSTPHRSIQNVQKQNSHMVCI